MVLVVAALLVAGEMVFRVFMRRDGGRASGGRAHRKWAALSARAKNAACGSLVSQAASLRSCQKLVNLVVDHPANFNLHLHPLPTQAPLPRSSSSGTSAVARAATARTSAPA